MSVHCRDRRHRKWGMWYVSGDGDGHCSICSPESLLPSPTEPEPPRAPTTPGDDSLPADTADDRVEAWERLRRHGR